MSCSIKPQQGNFEVDDSHLQLPINRNYAGGDGMIFGFRRSSQLERIGSVVFDSFRQLSKKTAGIHFSGILFAAGWWMFIDGVCAAARLHADVDNIGFEDYVPGVLATIAFIMYAFEPLVSTLFLRINMIHADLLSDSFNSDAWKARLWFFMSLALMLGSLGGAILLAVLKYFDANPAMSYHGAMLITQSALILLSSITFFVVRNYVENDVAYSSV